MKEIKGVLSTNTKRQPRWKKLNKCRFLRSELYFDMQVGREDFQN